VMFKGADGSEKTASLNDLQPKTLTQKLFSYFSPSERFELNAINDALDQHHTHLISQRDSLEEFASSVREIAKNYEQELIKLEQQMSVTQRQQNLQPDFTAKEISQIEYFASGQSDLGVRTGLEAILRSAVATAEVNAVTAWTPNFGKGP